MAEAILTIRNLEKRFGDKEVLRGLSLSIPKGSVFGFVGRNGAGKTTTMKAILGLMKIDGGEILVDGERVVFGETATNRMIGYLPDVPEFYPFMTAREYLVLCGESLSMPKQEAYARADELLSLVGLEGETHRIKGFSRGMKQRLGIAQALFCRPKLLICDEPTSALDPIGRKEILDLLLSVKEETTVLFSTHILSDVERICTDIALLNNGTIAVQGTLDELKKTRSFDAFSVECHDENACERLLSHFDNTRRGEENTVIFAGGDERIFAVMETLLKEKIAIRRIEKLEPTVETMFMEVIGE